MEPKPDFFPFFSVAPNDVRGVPVFEDALARLFTAPAARPWSPPVDIYEADDQLFLKADLPEVDPKNIGIEIESGTLTLKGERKFEEQKGGKGFHRIERSYGSFTRAFSLPDTVIPEKIKADYKDGVLTITLPKKQPAKVRTFQVRIDTAQGVYHPQESYEVTSPMQQSEKVPGHSVAPGSVPFTLVFNQVPAQKTKEFVSRLREAITEKGGQLDVSSDDATSGPELQAFRSSI